MEEIQVTENQEQAHTNRLKKRLKSEKADGEKEVKAKI